MILITGPYRSGTDNNPKRIAQDMKNVDLPALPILGLKIYYDVNDIPDEQN